MRKAIYWDGTQFLPVDENSMIELTGDVTGTGYDSFLTTLKNSGVTAGSYGSSSLIPTITVNAKGVVTGITTNSVSIPSGLAAGSTSSGYVQYQGTATETNGQWNAMTSPTFAGTQRLNYNGYLYATRVYGAVYNDYAEFFEKGEELEPGDVVCKKPNENKYIKSYSQYDKQVVGVYSDSYGHCLGGTGADDEENFIPVGLAGRVDVKVCGLVQEGDLLVSSRFPGMAMSAAEYIPGTVIGKALESNNSEFGKIKMLIMNI